MGQTSREIQNRVMHWEDVSSRPHRYGGVEFRLGKRELGHLHGDSLLDLPFPMKIRNDLIAEGRAEHHHILPESGWVSFRISGASDIEQAIDLLRLSYELALHAATEQAIRSTNFIKENQHI